MTKKNFTWLGVTWWSFFSFCFINRGEMYTISYVIKQLYKTRKTHKISFDKNDQGDRTQKKHNEILIILYFSASNGTWSINIHCNRSVVSCTLTFRIQSFLIHCIINTIRIILLPSLKILMMISLEDNSKKWNKNKNRFMLLILTTKVRIFKKLPFRNPTLK